MEINKSVRAKSIPCHVGILSTAVNVINKLEVEKTYYKDLFVQILQGNSIYDILTSKFEDLQNSTDQ